MIRHAFIHRLLVNLTDNEIQTLFLDPFLEQFNKFQIKSSSSDSESSSPRMQNTSLINRPQTPKRNHSPYFQRKQIRITEGLDNKRKTEEVLLTEEDILEINQILELPIQIKKKTAKKRFIELIEYLLKFLRSQKSLPIELLNFIFAIFETLNGFSGELTLDAKVFGDSDKTHLLFTTFDSVVRDKKKLKDIEKKLADATADGFENLQISFYIGEMVNELYKLKANILYIVKYIDDIFSDLKKKRSIDNYLRTICNAIDSYAKNPSSITNNPSKLILKILIDGYFKLQPFKKNINQLKFFQYGLLRELLTDENYDPIVNQQFQNNYLTWFSSKDFNDLRANACSIIHSYRDAHRNNILLAEYDKQFIRFANAVLNKAKATETNDSLNVQFIDKLSVNTNKKKSAYFYLHRKKSPHFYFLNGIEELKILEKTHINYIKALATNKLDYYKISRKNNPLYFIYDLLFKGDLGANNKEKRITSAKSLKNAVLSLNNYTDFTKLITTITTEINNISDNNSLFKAELRTISYRIFKLLSKVAPYDEKIKYNKNKILKEILNVYLREIFCFSSMENYPTVRKSFNINDDFFGILTKLKFKAENFFLDETTYRQNSLREFYYIENIDNHLKSYLDLSDDFSIAEFYTKLFELLADAADNIDNINIINHIIKVREILIKLFKPLHDPNIDSVLLPFSEFQQQRIRDTLNNQNSKQDKQDDQKKIEVNAESNIEKFKRELTILLHSHLLAMQVLSTEKVARNPTEIDMLLQLVDLGGKAVRMTTTSTGLHILGFGASTIASTAAACYDEYHLKINDEFTQKTGIPSERDQLINTIVDKTIEWYEYQITKLVHPIDIQKFAKFIAERILTQVSSPSNTNEALAEAFVHNIWRHSKTHKWYGFFDEKVIDQNSSHLKISKLCTRPDVAIQVSGHYKQQKMDSLQFYHRARNTRPEKYGYLTYSSKFQIKFESPNNTESLSTYFIQPSNDDGKYQLFYFNDGELSNIALEEVESLNELLKNKIDKQKLLSCFAKYHGEQCAKKFALHGHERETEIEFQPDEYQTKGLLKNTRHESKKLEIVGFFHNKFAMQNEEERLGVNRELNLSL